MGKFRAKYWTLFAVMPLGGGLLAMWIMENSGFDRACVELCFDRELGEFPWRQHWLTEGVAHRFGKFLPIGAALFAAAALAASRWNPRLRSWRREMLMFVAAMILGPVLTSAGKDLSDVRCPWDLAEFGGWAKHERNSPEDGTVGRRGCFPCGQASAGFALMSGFFALRRRKRGWALAALALGLSYGTAQGALRVLQGAHYPSHVMGTAMVCWSVALALDALLLRNQRDRGAGATGIASARSS